MNFWQLVTLVDLQARTSLKSEASKLYLSYLWWVLEPILFVAVFWIVFGFLLDRGTPEFVFFLMCGKVPYLWLSKTVTVSANSLLENRGLIATINIPKVVFPYISIQELLYKQWIVFLVLLLVTLYYGRLPNLGWLWLGPIIVTNYLLLVSLSLIASILVTYVQDFRILINMSMMFLMFASGIFWDINDINNEFWRSVLLNANPLAFLIDAYRRVLMYDQPIDLLHLSSIAFGCLVVIGFMHYLYKRLNLMLAQQVLQS